MTTIYVGIDVAKNHLDVAVWLARGGQSLTRQANTPEGFAALATVLAGVIPNDQQIHLVLEPTGGYELALVNFALEQSWLVSLPNPKQVRDWAKGQGRRAKTDRQDALMLAEYGATQQPAPQAALPENLRQLELLLARQLDLQQMLRQERNRQHSLAHRPNVAEPVQSSVDRLIDWLVTELAQIEQALADLIDQDPDLRAKLKRLREVPGIGPKNGPHLLLLLARWQVLTAGQGTPKELTAHVGLDPQTFQSGTSVFKRATISKMGNPVIRSLLYMGALGGVRGQNPLRTFYQRLVGRGKAKPLALVASARKILTWAWIVFSRDIPFDPAKIDPSFAG